MAESAQVPQEENPLEPDQLCVANQDFLGEEEGDLAFKKGDFLTIVEPCELLFWYTARNAVGGTGMVPGNFLRPLESEFAPKLPPKSKPSPHSSPKLPHSAPSPQPSASPQQLQRSTAASTFATSTAANGRSEAVKGGGLAGSTATAAAARSGHGGAPDGGGYLDMQRGGGNAANHLDRDVVIMQEREKQRRLKSGVLVIGISPFPGEQPGDLPFNVYDEMTIIKPLPDLCWYQARMTDDPEKRGAIPVTHITLVYLSDDEDDSESIYKSPTKPGHERLYDDVNEFIIQSGWFSFPGQPHGKKALMYVLAKKARMSHNYFMTTKRAVYMLKYMEEKVFVGMANILHEELEKHFDCFNKKREEIREIDDELCHHTDASGWELVVWPLMPGQDLEVECGKKMIERDSLTSKEEGAKGLVEEMTFTSMDSFDKFWDWFSPI